VNQGQPGATPDSKQNFPPQKAKSRLLRWLPPIGAAAAATLIACQGYYLAQALAMTTPVRSAPAVRFFIHIPLAMSRMAPAVPSAQLAERLAALDKNVAVVVGRNDTLDTIFRRMALNVRDLASIRSLPGIRQSLDMLRPGEAIQLTHRDGAISGLSRAVSDTQMLQVVRDQSGFAARLIEHPFEAHRVTASSTIDSSLFEAAAQAHLSDAIAVALTDIFQWDIDFVLDIREGDRFTVVYEKLYQDGVFKRDGAVLAAEFVHGDKVYRAVRHLGANGAGTYYTPDGRPMRKAFLRAPVQFTRVSSRFNPHRYHPILNIIRGHMGTDYAAPIGTPVHVASDGRIAFRGRKGGYGNVIIVDHANGVSTIYGHLSRFRQDLRIGSRVTQGQVIAFVGMTGLATGPHLHYEYIVHGVHKNPETLRLAGAAPLSPLAQTAFAAEAAPLVAALDAADHPSVAATTWSQAVTRTN
jgi:murein DD-endopeptidase MepM/ murein hydrolase activator NlpD